MHDSNNFAQQNSALIRFKRFEDVVFTTNRFAIPEVQTVNPNIQGPRSSITLGPTGIVYGTWNLEYFVTESLSNTRKLIEWLQELDKPADQLYSDASVLLLNGQKKHVATVKFINVIPVLQGPINFSYQVNPENPYIYTTASFRYMRYEFVDVN